MGNTAASWKNATKKLSNGYEKLTDTILKHKKIAIPLLYVILIAIPFLGPSQYFIRVLCLIGVYSILTLSLNLIAGYMGQTSMGHAALYCLGGYFSALLGSYPSTSSRVNSPLRAVSPSERTSIFSSRSEACS